MKYNEIYTTDKTIIDRCILEANLNFDSSIIILVNEFIHECSFDNQEIAISAAKNNTIDNNCCCPFLFSYFYNEPSEHTDTDSKIELIMFLQNLSKDEICMLAEYHNIYYKNRLFKRIMDKEQWIFDEKLQITTMIYDNICIYMYKRKYNHRAVLSPRRLGF